MSTLNFIITDSGFQAAVNADSTGLQLTLTDVAYGSGIWSPDTTATALQNEIKRLPAGGGQNPAPDYVHVTATDQSSDSYQANEVGIYAGDTLFAIWSKGLEPDSDGPSKISTQFSAFAFDLLLGNIPPSSVTVNDVGFSVPIATETVYGVAKLGTLEEVIAGVNQPLIVTPYILKQWRDQTIFSGYVGQIFTFTTPVLPDGFPGFICNGSLVPNGRIDFPKLATSGSGWITVQGDDLVIHDSPDFTRGQGSSARSVGEYQLDSVVSHNHAQVVSGLDNNQGNSTGYTVGNPSIGYNGGDNTSLDSTRYYGGAETTPKSKTVLRAIYHGEL